VLFLPIFLVAGVAALERVATYFFSDFRRGFHSTLTTFLRRFGSGMNRWAKGIAGGWTFSGVFMSHSGFPLPFPNAAPLVAKSARLSDAQRDGLAQQAGRAH